MAGGRASKPLDPRYEVRDASAEESVDLLPLMRAYCDFYGSDPPDAGLLEMARALASEPEQGAIFIARELAGEVAAERRAGDAARQGAAVGFAALSWKWSSLRGARIGVLEDLFCDPGARGRGVAEALIEACAQRCRERGAPALEWVTATGNHRAQAVYERVGASGGEWRIYELDPGSG